MPSFGPCSAGSLPQPLHIGISWGVCALLAWANGRGYAWARMLFGVWFGLHTVALAADIAQGAAFSAPVWTVISALVFWLVECSAVVLILTEGVGPLRRRKPVQP